MKKIFLAAMLFFGMLASAMAAQPCEFEKNATPENAVLVYGFASYIGAECGEILFTHFDKNKPYVSTITKVETEIDFKYFCFTKRCDEVNLFWGMAYPNSTYNFVYYTEANVILTAGVGFETDSDFTTAKEAGTLQYLGCMYLSGFPSEIEKNSKTIKENKIAELKARIKALKIMVKEHKKGSHWYDVINAEIKKLQGELENEK